MKRSHPLFAAAAGISLASILLAGSAPRDAAHAQRAAATTEFHLSGSWSPQGVLNPFSPNNIATFEGMIDTPLSRE